MYRLNVSNSQRKPVSVHNLNLFGNTIGWSNPLFKGGNDSLYFGCLYTVRPAQPINPKRRLQVFEGDRTIH